MRHSLLVTAVIALLGVEAGWGQGYVAASYPGFSGGGFDSPWNRGPSWGGWWGSSYPTPLPVDAFGYRSPSGGHRSYRYLHGRDGLASRRPRRHSTRTSGINAQGQWETTDYYYDSRDEAHYFDSAARSRVYEGYGSAGSYATSWPGVFAVETRPQIIGDAPYLYGGRPSWRGSWGQGYVLGQRGR